jgi:APA family basic amino acid/polyamine antiporter
MTPAPAAKPDLVRAIGRWSLVALVLNGIIGSGIFGLPSAVAKLVGPGAPWAYLGGALGIGVIMAVFAEVSSQFRETGGQYLWARTALGRFAGIHTGWFVWLVRLTSGAAVINIFVTYLGEFWPGATAPLTRAIIMTAVVAIFTAVNIRGVKAGASASNFFTVAKLAPLALFVVVGLVLAPRVTPAAPAIPPTAGIWIDALVAMMFAFGGFESAMIPAAEAKDPRRDMPFALLTALAVVSVFYLLIHVIAMWSVPNLAASPRPLADAARAFAGDTGARLISLGAMISTIGWVSAAFLTVPRLTYGMAERGDFPAIFGRVHPRFRTPWVSIVVWAVLILTLSIAGNFIWNAILSAAARLVTFVVTCAALLKLRRDQPQADAWRAPAGQLLALLGLGFCVLLITRLETSHGLVIAAITAVAAANWLAVRQR